MGRPLKGDVPLTDRIFIRVNKETKEMLDICTKEYNTTRSEIVREGIKRMFDDLKK